MSLSTQPYKGARDFYPDDKRFQKYMFGVLRDVVESFGYQEYDAPILEPLDLYLAKTGEEIVNHQLYSFEDKGGRKMAIRPEMTPSVSRMVAARRQELTYPLRLYSIPNLWRYERPQKGRLREHWQLNVDLFGIAGIEADLEIIQVADAIMKAFGASHDMYKFKIGSRKLIDAVLTGQGMDAADKKLFLKISDNWEKFDSDEARVKYIHEVVDEAGYGDDKKHNFLENLDERGPAFQAAVDGPAGEKVRNVRDFLQKQNVNVELDMYLARGFEYYDDIIFEVVDTSADNNRSMFGGGRYDGLVGLFGVDPVPTVGFGMGDVTLQIFLETHQLLPRLQVETDAMVILIGDVYSQAQQAVTELRKKGVRLAVDSSGRKLDSQIKSAVKSGVRYAIFIGDKELESNQFKLRDLEKGEEQSLSLDQIASTLAVRHSG